jgi:hypothetical protein
MPHRQAFASRNMSEELQTVFEAVIRVVNYVKNSPLKETLFAKLCDDTEQNTWHCYISMKHSGPLMQGI